MEQNWIKVYTTTNIYAAEILKQGLNEANIPAVLINKQLAAYHFGEVNVLVHPDHFNQAIEYILENEIQ
ncbi:putative signal transducing protein [Pedobacter sp. SYP-B3415]|uniref:putative signal transducing protein n=1 Tax=Pedobacter sp. SYP-B3415 TaxID=2496641 RepID=UPI0013ED56DA|nr:DUF2007 domain-containing protein [Pedobacter sp. SYP-B3415]